VSLAACTDLGNKISINPKSEVFFKGEGVSEDDARRLGTFLLQQGYFDTTTAKTAHLSKDGDDWMIRMVINEAEYARDKARYRLLFWRLQEIISRSVFGGADALVIFADKNVKDLEPVGAIGKVAVNPRNTIFFRPEATAAEARKVGDVLTKAGYFTGSNDLEVLLFRDSGRHQVSFVVNEAILAQNEEALLPYFKVYKYLIGKEALAGAPNRVTLINTEFGELKEVEELTPEERTAVEAQFRSAAPAEAPQP
ncbi:MAG TPA: hypothetical protein VHK69_14150, partial [Chitinophagaceae bacterium]|nr:hypothetical protein [Chitinophagaceae bacterium]